MEAQQAKPGICPVCGSDNVTMRGQNLTGRAQAPAYSTCGHCEYSWYRTSTVPTAHDLWKLYKLRRQNAHTAPYALANYQRVDRAYRWWLIRVRPATVLPYPPIHK